MKLKLLAAAAMLAIAMPANATLIVNGNFDNALANWTTGSIGGVVGFVSTNFQIGDPLPAAQFRTGTDNFKTLSQSVATVVGQRYLLTYSILNQAAASNQFDVTTGDRVTSTVFADPFAEFTTFSQSFVASSELSLIRFAVNHTGASRQFFFIDNVSLIDIVPEPENWALLIAGFGLVGAAARRRRNGRALVA